MLNNVVGYWAYIRGTYIWGAYIPVGLYSGGLNIWNEVSVSICGGLIFGGGAYIRGGGLIVGGLWYTNSNRRREFVYQIQIGCECFNVL